MSRQKRSKIFYILNVIMIVLLLFDLFKVKSLLSDNYIVNDSSLLMGYFQNVPLLSDMFKVFTDTFGTNSIVYGFMSIFTIDIIYYVILCLPFDIIDFIKSFKR